ncbi:hypothetical protein RhiJN_09002 [Ceratobasidium sp. AG-Ba]|nr:hypothetical protein RhiJN_09002 [Ceratobasidium sp. AG-Ba]
MTTALTVPLDDWVMANSRPMKTESLDDLRALGSRRDYAKLTVEEAFSLLYHTCKARFGDLKPLYFDVKESDGPLAYSSTLTVTGPDDIGIEFPNSGWHPTAMVAKMHAAYKAVQQGVIAFLMQGLSLSIDSTSSVKQQIGQSSPAPLTQTSSRPVEVKQSPSRGNQLDPTPILQQPLPQKPSVGLPVASSFGSKPKNIPVYDGPNPTPIPSSNPPAPPTKPPTKTPSHVDKSPVSIINELLQKVYSAKKMHKQANTGLRWEQKKYPEGSLARMTVVLPSGAKKSYGSVPEVLSEKYRTSKYPLKPELLPNVAKRSVATYAIKLGVLDFIASEDVSGKALASVGLSVRLTTLPPRPPVPSGSGSVQLNAPPVQNTTDSHPNDPTPKLLPAAISPIKGSQTSVPTPTTTSKDADGYARTASTKRPPSGSLEPGQISPETSSKISNETFNASIESHHPTRERLGSYEPLVEEDEQSQSESMDLDSDTRGNSVVSNTGRKVSPEMEAEVLDEQPPKKRLKTDTLVSEKSASPEAEVKEPKVMHGPSYVNILSTYCAENDRPQPQVTYQRQLNESDPNAPSLYHLSLVIGTRRYELSKHYESVESAEEKLSKRILKLFGVQAKKI